jgi:hypothetical protein
MAAVAKALDNERSEHARLVSAIKADGQRVLPENEAYASRLSRFWWEEIRGYLL